MLFLSKYYIKLDLFIHPLTSFGGTAITFYEAVKFNNCYFFSDSNYWGSFINQVIFDMQSCSHRFISYSYDAVVCIIYAYLSTPSQITFNTLS